MTEIRTLDPADLAAWYAAMGRGFLLHNDPHQVAEARRPTLDFTRTIAAYDGSEVVGTFRSLPTELTVPGGARLPADAITNVTVSATHRRQGLLTGMMRHDLDAARERGEPLAILIASEWLIYGRYGFGPATEHASWQLDARAARFVDGGAGTVRYAGADEMRAVAPGVYDRHRALTPGEIARNALRWDAAFGQHAVPWIDLSKDIRVICDDAGGTPAGYAVYRVEDKWADRRPDAVVEVQELVAATPEAGRRLWRFLAELDLVTTVKAADRSVAEPLRWALADSRAMWQTMRADFLWVRLLDVERSLAARRYLAPGRVVLEVVDPGGHAGGRFALDGGPDGATCARTDAAPDLTLDAQALGTVYLGGVTLGELAVGCRVVEHRAGALATADAMFRGATTPWSATWF